MLLQNLQGVHFLLDTVYIDSAEIKNRIKGALRSGARTGRNAWGSFHCYFMYLHSSSHVKGSPYSITERRVPELIPVLGSQPAGDVSHTCKPNGRLPLLSARPAVTPNL